MWRFSLRTLLLLVLTIGAGATLWKNALPWRIERAFSGFEEPCDTVRLSPDGKWILAEIKRRGEEGKPDYTKSKLWDVESGRCTELDPVVHRRANVNEPGYGSAYLSPGFSSDSRFVLTGFSTSRAHHFKLWDLQKGSEVVLSSTPFATKRAMFSPNGRFLLRLSNQVLQLFDLHTSNLVLEQSNVTEGDFSADSMLLATCNADDSIGVFKTDNGQLLHHFGKREDCALVSIRHVSRDRVFVFVMRQIPTATNVLFEQYTLLFDLKNAEHPPEYLLGIVLSTSPDGNKAIIASSTGYHVMDIHSLERSRTPLANQFTEEWAPDGVHVFNGGQPALFDINTGRCLFEIEDASFGMPLAGFTRFVCLYGEHEDNVTIHDMRDGRLLQNITGEKVHLYNRFAAIHFVTQNKNSHAIHYWSRYRPEVWWGLGLLPEAWVLLVLSGILAWSLRRDWKNT